MKKVFAASVCVLMAMIGLLGVAGCNRSNVEYKVKTADMFYSVDHGEKYSSGPAVVQSGESVYLMVVVDVETDGGEDHVINGELSFSGESMEVSYLKGQKTVPVADEKNGVTVYPFEITTNENCELYFEVVPNGADSVDIALVFDDALPDKYDVAEKISVVEEV